MRKKDISLLMINDEAKNSYYFAVKKLLDLNSKYISVLQW